MSTAAPPSYHDYDDGGGGSGGGELDDEDDDSEDDEDGLPPLNLQNVMECLKNYRTFERPIKLRMMIDIVTVLWEDEPM